MIEHFDRFGGEGFSVGADFEGGIDYFGAKKCGVSRARSQDCDSNDGNDLCTDLLERGGPVR